MDILLNNLKKFIYYILFKKRNLKNKKILIIELEFIITYNYSVLSNTSIVSFNPSDRPFPISDN